VRFYVFGKLLDIWWIETLEGAIDPIYRLPDAKKTVTI